jgi:hypothetical protein
MRSRYPESGLGIIVFGWKEEVERRRGYEESRWYDFAIRFLNPLEHFEGLFL